MSGDTTPYKTRNFTTGIRLCEPRDVRGTANRPVLIAERTEQDVDRTKVYIETRPPFG